MSGIIKIRWVIISFVVRTVLGTGSIWTYMEHRLNEAKYIFEKQKELRNRRDNNLKKIIEMSPILRKKVNEARGKNVFDEHLRLMLASFKNTIENFNNDEVELAKIESRDPIILTLVNNISDREIILDYAPPPAPYNFSVEVK